MQNLNRILVYTDLSPASAEALRTAHVLARATHASLEVLRVIAEPLAADWTSELGTAGMPAVQEAMETEAQEWMESVLGEVALVGVQLGVEMGDPAGELARHAGQQGSELVVIGAGDEEGGAGPVADMVRRLLDSARCSVLVVRVP